MVTRHWNGQPSRFGPTSYERAVDVVRQFVRCADCGERLWVTTTQSGAYYRDASKQRGIECAGGGFIKALLLDNEVDALIANLRLPPAW